MAVRLDVEQQAQQALRDQLAAATSERSDTQERLTVMSHEVEELRTALEDSRAELAGKAASERALQTVEQRLQALEQDLQQTAGERDTAREAEAAAAREIEHLREELEAQRALAEQQSAAGDSEASLREQLEQMKKNVDAAVRLRSEAEDRVATLQQEVDRLHAASGASEAADSGAAQIPSLDDSDPEASSLLNPAFDEDVAVTRQLADDEQPADSASAEPRLSFATSEHAPASGGPGGIKGLLAGLLIGVAGASGAAWWLMTQQSPPPWLQGMLDTAATLQGVGGGADPATDAGPEVEQGDREITPVVPGMPEHLRDTSRAGEAGSEQAGEVAPEPRESDRSVDSVGTESSSENAAQVTEQPAGSFRDRLSNGGRGPVMVKLSADRFDMGSGPTSQNFDERPRHQVSLRRFAISRHEVTFDQYDRFARATGRARPRDAGWGRGDRPVVNVSWQDAVAYTEWLSGQTGETYRLPSEAEWEFAARSGSIKRYWWGNQVGKGHANCFDCGGDWAARSTAPVGRFPASAWGLHDMAGNAREWVQDCYADDYKTAAADGSAYDTPGCKERAIRGGSYSSPSSELRSAARDHDPADTRVDDLGFRVVRQY
jgi:formylglycine-generating enzyme required for sulfatase activity